MLGEGAGIVMFLKNWSMQRQRGAKIYAELTGYGATGMLIISLLLQRMEQARRRAMELAMEEAGVHRQRWNTSTHMEQARTTTTCLRQERSKGIWRCGKRCCDQLNEIHDRSSAWCSRRCGIYYLCEKSMEEGFIHQTVGTQSRMKSVT